MKVNIGIHSSVQINEKNAIKTVKPDFEELYIRELLCIRYLNIVAPDRTWFPKLIGFSLSKLSMTMELLDVGLGKSVESITKEQAESYQVQIIQAYSDLHALGIAHNNARLSNIMIKSDGLNICLIDFGEIVKYKREDGSRNYRIDLPGIGYILLNLSLRERIRDKFNSKIIMSKVSSLDSKECKISYNIRKFMERKGRVASSLENLGVSRLELHKPRVNLEIQSPVYYLDVWVKKIFDRFNLDQTFDHIILTTIICTIMKNRDSDFTIPYGIAILYLYSCLYGGDIKMTSCLEICPNSFGNEKYKKILFGYLLDDLIGDRDLIIMLFQSF